MRSHAPFDRPGGYRRVGAFTAVSEDVELSVLSCAVGGARQGGTLHDPPPRQPSPGPTTTAAHACPFERPFAGDRLRHSYATSAVDSSLTRRQQRGPPDVSERAPGGRGCSSCSRAVRVDPSPPRRQSPMSEGGLEPTHLRGLGPQRSDTRRSGRPQSVQRAHVAVAFQPGRSFPAGDAPFDSQSDSQRRLAAGAIVAPGSVSPSTSPSACFAPLQRHGHGDPMQPLGPTPVRFGRRARGVDVVSLPAERNERTRGTRRRSSCRYSPGRGAVPAPTC